jgi:hypothetical protein
LGRGHDGERLAPAGPVEAGVAEGSFQADGKTLKPEDRFNHALGTEAFPFAVAQRPLSQWRPQKFLGGAAPFTQALYDCGKKNAAQYIGRI